MGWKQWLAVGVVIGGGILLQIPGHDAAPMDHRSDEHTLMPSMAEPQGPFETVALNVTGMT